MPPPKSGRKLTPQQIELRRLWIEQGAKWDNHLSFIPPQRPATTPQLGAWWVVQLGCGLGLVTTSALSLRRG